MRRILIGVLAMALSAAPAAAQGRAASCATATLAQLATADACEKARDLFDYMMPQLGTALVGGSHTLGIGSSLGGFPHFAVALRMNTVRSDLPKVSGLALSPLGAARSTISTSGQFIALPAADFAVGVFKGFPLGVTNVGGVDLIGNVTHIPGVGAGGVKLTPQGGSTKIGLGARIGLLEQSLVVPGVSFSYMKRDVPTLDLLARAGNDTLSLKNFGIQTTSWRLAAQKNLLLFQLAAGIGQDTYKSGADITVKVVDPLIPGGSASTVTNPRQSLSRTSMYGSLGFNLLVAKVVAEVGQVSGGSVKTYNTFSAAADKSRLYGSVGIRVSF